MSKANKSDIGKGIKALLSNAEKKRSQEVIASSADNVVKRNDFELLDINMIVINPFQPRTEFVAEEIEELAQSIKLHGIIQPITVRQLSAKEYQIISGERRFRASKQAGLSVIPAFIRKTDDQGMLELAILENIQRADLNPMEIAISCQRLLNECDLTHDELADRLSKKRSSITNYLRLLRLPPAIQRAIKDTYISLGHAKVLAGIENVEDQMSLFNTCMSKQFSVRELELAVKNLYVSKKKPMTSHNMNKSYDPEIKHIEMQLSDHLGTKAEIKRDSAGKGSIVIPFKSDKDLNALLTTILSD